MRTGVLAAGWVVAAALTVGASWSAVSVVRDSVVARTDVATALPTPEETGAPSRSTRPPSPGTPAARAVGATGQGGSVTVRCVRGVPTFLNVTPKQGYTVERDDGSPEVKFSSSTHRTQITAGCTGDTARTAVEEKDRSGGGSGGDDG